MWVTAVVRLPASTDMGGSFEDITLPIGTACFDAMTALVGTKRLPRVLTLWSAFAFSPTATQREAGAEGLQHLPAQDPALSRARVGPVPERLDLPIRTERLVLRAHTPDDAEALLSYYGDEETSRYLLTEPIGAARAAELARERVAHTDLHQAGDRLSLALEHEGRLVGDLMLVLKGEPGSKMEIGWVMHPDATGRGLAAEGARAVLELAFAHYGAHRVHAELDARNHASARLCERLGMIREGLLRQDWFSKGEWTDTLYYGVLRDEWAALRPEG